MTLATRPFLLCAFLGMITACGRSPARAASAKLSGVDSCRYDAELAESGRNLLTVELRCSGRLQGFRAVETLAARHILDLSTLGGEPLSREGSTWLLEGRLPEVRYQIDLDALANDARDFDVALRVGGSLVTPASSWLLQPEPVPIGAPLSLHVSVPPGTSFVTALKPAAASAWQLEAHELRVATYTVFGKFQHDKLELRGQNGARALLEVVKLDGRVELEHETLLEWMRDAATAVGDFWAGFPVPRALVVVIPVPDRSGVLFGKVLPESAPGVAIVLGEQPGRLRELYRDWILVHELFHLGFPSFANEGKWLDEGLATYYEPIIRARAGWRSEHEVWTEFVRDMPQGLEAVEKLGLESGKGFRQIYWSGAIVSLLADVAARRASGGRRGLEHGLRALLAAGGHASEVWDLEQAIAVIDRELGSPILKRLNAEHSARGKPVGLDRLFAELGVVRVAGGVRLDDSAPLASVRRAIVWGDGSPPNGSAGAGGASRAGSQAVSSPPASRARLAGEPSDVN